MPASLSCDNDLNRILISNLYVSWSVYFFSSRLSSHASRPTPSASRRTPHASRFLLPSSHSPFALACRSRQHTPPISISLASFLFHPFTQFFTQFQVYFGFNANFLIFSPSFICQTFCIAKRASRKKESSFQTIF